MATATLRFYAELNDFLPARRRQRDWVLDFTSPAPVRHLIGTCGVPHTEVELILRGGESIGLETQALDQDRLAVFPMFERFDVRPLLRLRQRPLRRPRFLADAHLGALARRLRMLGFDTLWHNDLGDGRLARLAAAEHRILLTRDRGLLMRQEVSHGCYVRPGPASAQLADLVRRLDLCAEIAPFSRCMACNGPLTAVERSGVDGLVAPFIYRRHREYWRCRGCGRIYWRGTHWAAMSGRIDSICPRREPGARTQGDGIAPVVLDPPT